MRVGAETGGREMKAKIYTFDDADRVISNCHGFDDSSTGAGFAWEFVKHERTRLLDQIDRLKKCIAINQEDYSGDTGCAAKETKDEAD
jgi:hypothetical protein